VNFVDLLVLAGVGASVVNGVRTGLVGVTAGAIGAVAGLLLGSAVAADVVEAFELRGGAEVFFATVIVVAAVALVSFVLQVAAAPVAASIRRLHLGWVDRGGGGVVGFVLSITIAWLLGGVLATGPSQGLARGVQDSVLLREIDERFPAAPGVVADLQQALIDHGMPLPFVGFEPRLDPVEPPSTEALAAAQAAAAGATVRVFGAGCGGGVTGSGVVVAPGVVVTNAHVVGGIDEVNVDATDGGHAGVPVMFDADTDLAVLRVDGLGVAPLPLAPGDVATGAGAAVLGYPGGGPLVVSPAAVLDRRNAVGRDIYGNGTVTREVYILQSAVRPGDSGGPFVDAAGTVLGIVFARSNIDDGVGYALTADEVRDALATVPAVSSAPEVDTGSCAR
jgi:S1-C subfamily serine protease